MRSVSLTLDEEERQSVLLALAMLSLERPGWDDALNRIALKMDAKNDREQTRAMLYDHFRAIHRASAEQVRKASAEKRRSG